MGQISPKLRSVGVTGGDAVAFWCPGCDHAHVVAISGPKAWGYNGNAEAPTFTPSILIRVEWSKQPLEPGDNPDDWRDEVCHSIVTDGRIQFLGDCTHALKAQIVDMPDWPAEVVGMRR